MIRLVVGSLLFVAGRTLSFTVVRALARVPKAIAGFGISVAGNASLVTSTATGGVAAARFLNSPSCA